MEGCFCIGLQPALFDMLTPSQQAVRNTIYNGNRVDTHAVQRPAPLERDWTHASRPAAVDLLTSAQASISALSL